MIAVDWGSSSLRAFRLAADGELLEQRRSDGGVLYCNGRFGQTLDALIHDWPEPLVVMCGMVGSRQGWQEIDYVPCPASLQGIAAGMRRLPATALDGRTLWLVPGLHRHCDTRTDVMRGEETQVCGLLDRIGSGTHYICLPGTHSKLAHVDNEIIVDFSTAMTGEVFHLLRQHSVLGLLMQGGEHDARAFDRGIDDSAAAGGLLQHLFAVRTHALFASIPAEALAAYLSGLLVGHELRGRPIQAQRLILACGDALRGAYSQACARLGIATASYGEDCSARGLYRLAQARGLVAADTTAALPGTA